MSVKSHLTSGASVCPENSVTYSTEGQKICRYFSETAPLQRYIAYYIVGYCSDFPCTFLTAEPSKDPQKANYRLNSTWNTTRCKVASFFPFRILSVSVCAFKDSRTLTVLHFSAYRCWLIKMQYVSCVLWSKTHQQFSIIK